MTYIGGTMPLGDLLAEHVAEVALVYALEVTPWRVVEPHAETMARAQRLREATAQALAIIDRERRGVAVRPPFAGPLQALRALADWRLDGVAIAGTSVWERLSLDPSGGAERPSSTVERLADVALHWSACLSDGWTLSTYPARCWLSAPQARAVVLCAVLGCPGTFVPVQSPQARSGEGVRPALDPRHIVTRLRALGRPLGGGDVDRFSDPSPSEVAGYVSTEIGLVVPKGHVTRLRAAGIGEVYRRLAGCGLVPRSERMETMAADDRAWDLSGWKEIASYLGWKPRTAMRYANRAEHPLPVSRIGVDRIVAVRSEIAQWTREEMRRGRRIVGR